MSKKAEFLPLDSDSMHAMIYKWHPDDTPLMREALARRGDVERLHQLNAARREPENG